MERWRQYFKNERGSQLIEFFAVFPMVIMALLFIWQMALVGYAVVVAEAAARDGARVAAVDGDFRAAVERAAFGLDVRDVDISRSSTSYGEEVTVIVTAMIPSIKIPFFGRFEHELTADASMPREVND